jgi:hypothetical protein
LFAALLLVAGCAHVDKASSEEPYTGPVIDMHAHVLTPEEMATINPGMPSGSDALLELARKAQVAHTGLIVMARKGDPEKVRAMNDSLLATTRASGGALFPIASVHPDDGDAALEELERLAGLGVKVIKLHPNTQRFDVGSPAVAAVVAKTAELGLVILFDGFSPFDANQTGKFVVLAVQNPKARLILAHMGGTKFDEMAQFGLISRFPWYARNIWVDLSAQAHFYVDSPYEEQLVWVVRQIGVDRALFGSDYPVDTPEHAREDIRRLGFTREEQQRLFYTNAAELLGLQNPSR